MNRQKSSRLKREAENDAATKHKETIWWAFPMPEFEPVRPAFQWVHREDPLVSSSSNEYVIVG
jgi:hypothetical protein